MSEGKNRVPYVVFAKATGDIIRFGHCAERDVALQAGQGQAAIADAIGNDVEHRVIMPANGAKPYVRRRSVADIAARKSKAIEPLGIDHLLGALNEKGINITRADLEAVRDRRP